MPKQPRNHDPTIGIFDLLERTDTDEAQTTPLRGHPDLTLRDEANAITARVFRNGFLEDLHAGQERHPLHRDAGWGGEDDENRKLVLFVRHLPDLSDKELQLMKEINGLDTTAAHHAAHEEK